MNKKKYKMAAALKYKMGDKAPVVIAKGEGYIAQKILDIAKENDIPFYIDDNCESLLKYMQIDKEIPEELFEVVAKILVFVNAIDSSYSSNK